MVAEGRETRSVRERALKDGDSLLRGIHVVLVVLPAAVHIERSERFGEYRVREHTRYGRAHLADWKRASARLAAARAHEIKEGSLSPPSQIGPS